MTISDEGDWFECECGQFAHMRMLCCHALKVMDHVGVQEIPKRHILKRWMKDARDILPQHIAHFQKDQAANQSFTCRSSTLYLHAMELVRIGDSSISAYELVLARIKDLIVEASPLAENRDGLGIEDRIAAESSRKNNGSVGAIINIDAQMGDNENSMTASGNWDALAGLSAPSKKRGVGRPCSSREKAPYEGLSKRTRFCSICKVPGHKRTTCPDRGDVPKQPRKPVTCKNCGVTGHRRTSCTRPLVPNA